MDNDNLLKPLGADRFIENLRSVLDQYGLSLKEEKWEEDDKQRLSSQSGKFYKIVFASQFIKLAFKIYDCERYFVSVEFVKQNSPEYFNRYNLYNFRTITGYPRFDTNSQGVQYLEEFSKYLYILFSSKVMSEILSGKYWHSFYFDLRDWATTPGLEQRLKAGFEESWELWRAKGRNGI